MKRCPACRAKINKDACCERCGCDLSWLLRIEWQASAMLRQAIVAIKNEKLNEAFKLLQRLRRLKSSALGAALLQFVSIQLGVELSSTCGDLASS